MKIKSCGFPDRCEICHQKDEYLPETNFCGRCSELVGKGELVLNKAQHLNITNLICLTGFLLLLIPFDLMSWIGLCFLMTIIIVVDRSLIERVRSYYYKSKNDQSM